MPFTNYVAMTMDTMSLKNLLPDLPPGPLSEYRKKASFDWRKLKLEMEDEDSIRYKNSIWDVFQMYDTSKTALETLPVDEQRLLAQNRLKLVKTKAGLNIDQILNGNPKTHTAWMEAIFMYDVAAGMGYSITNKMFPGAIKLLGSERHEKYLQAVENNEITGCFALTEIAHGSNAKGMRTTATHDPLNKEFILNSADFEAAKCWAGMLGKRATHAVIFAKLLTSDGKDQGLHAFVVPVRCPKTLRPLPGLVVGDMGEKMALNSVDNGFVMFNSYRIPEENLLNRLGDVDKNGNYFSMIENPNQRFGISMAILSMGRVQITGICTSALQKAITVAIRYSAVRKQFGPDNSNEEFPVLEYQQQQFRLIPYLSAAYVLRIFSNWFLEIHTVNESSPREPANYMEVHTLSSAAKPFISWLVRDAIQVCREACGGHGYLKAASFGDLRGENDANCTYEGENSLLLQQTSNWLLSLWKKLGKGDKISTPYNTAEFLNEFKSILNRKVKFSNVEDAINIENILNGYKWLVCYALKLTAEKVETLTKLGKDKTTARNESQSYHATMLSLMYAEHSVLENCYNFTKTMKDQSCKNVMLRMVSLFGAWCLEKHLGTLYIGGYFSGKEGELLRQGIINLCSMIAPDAVTLVDTFAIPDFILNSVLGNSDGQVYQNLQSCIFSSSDNFSRPYWWKEIVEPVKFPSKL